LTLVGGTLTSSASLTLNNPLTLNNANTIIAGFGAINFSGTATLTGVNTLNITNTSNVTLSGKLTGPGSLQKLGSFTSPLTLSPPVGSDSDYAGGTVLQAGNLFITTANSALGSGGLTLAGGFLQTTVGGGISLANPVNLNGATVTLNGTQNLTFTGPVS